MLNPELFCKPKGSREEPSGKRMDLPSHAVQSVLLYTSYYTALFTALLSIHSSDIHRIKKCWVIATYRDKIQRMTQNIKHWKGPTRLIKSSSWMAHTGIKPTTVASLMPQSNQLNWVTILGFKGKENSLLKTNCTS